MGLLSTRFLRIPRPTTFLYVMSLRTGASLITLSLLLNKISGLYGLLALLTGYHLSPVQLSMYLYSLVALGLAALLFPHIRKQTPLQCLALAWLYVFDSVINAAYTAAFGVTWFLVISQHYDSDAASGPGSETIEQTAGFTNPKYDTSDYSSNDHEARSALDDGLSNAVSQPESFQSIVCICLLWIVRAYFVFVMLAFARQALRRYMAVPRHTQLPTHSRSTSMASVASVADIDREPFSPFSPEGQGWKGKLGRAMIGVGRNYWLGEDEDNSSWMNVVGPRLQPRGEPDSGLLPGPLERERRRRSGTGPPQPSQSAVQAAALQQPIYEQPPPCINVKMHDWNDPR
ncbi:inositol phosphorylceramide synthase regulatory subunit KEI1 [Aspergillus candidus]|uniref:DUF1753-domain-containing protein n=1 Tax=Aspergillus candidus TaxID=41067 RepID=A0A2I2FDZ8_ASPCN|nr:DUF1753-domain-containing protein [Aspergillus candidus]PLB38845.1 DUF1753-domain-containing protein [Aspergillus candidus]